MTDFYIEGNQKAVRKWTQLEEKVKNADKVIENKEMAMHYAELINYTNRNQSKSMLKHNRDRVKWYEDLVQKLIEEKETLEREKNTSYECCMELQNIILKKEKQVEVYKQLCEIFK